MKIPRRIERITTEEEQNIASELLDNHNKNLSPKNDKDDIHYAYISVGAQHKMFTLWNYFSLRMFKPDNFITILSNNLVTAVEKAIQKYPKRPIYLDMDTVYRKEEDNSWKFLSFGKYKDRHIDEIIIEDPEYVTWLLKENQKRAQSGKPVSKLAKYLFEISEYIWDVWKKYRTKKAEELSDSTKSYIGNIGDIVKFEVTVKNIFNIRDFFVYKMEDKDGNIITKAGSINKRYIYKKGNDNKNDEVEVGDILRFSADIRDHILSIRYPIGEKQTKIGRISKF